MIDNKNKFLDLDDDVDFITDTTPVDYEPLTKEQIRIGDELQSFLQSFIDNENKLDEEYVSTYDLDNHYRWHCLANKVYRKSDSHNVYYDFRNRDKYRIYEEEISDKVNMTPNKIVSLYDTDSVNKHFRKLFEGNYTIKLLTSCGLFSSIGDICFGINSFATNKTQNYTKGNTINILFMTPTGKTISMYPVDAHYFETKFNNILGSSSTYSGDYIKINND